MKLFKRFFKEAAPTNHTGASIANFDPMLFPPGEDDLSQDYQTPGESGLAKWRFSNVWPVMKLTMKGIDSMVDASQEYTKLQDESRQNVLRKNFNQFIEESAIKVTGLNGTVPKCKEGMEYDKKLNACVPIKTKWSGYHGAGSFNVRIKQGNTNGNGNGNGSDNGNGNGHAGGNGNGSGNGNGGGGNGG